MATKPEVLWFVHGKYGVYCGGGWLTRKQAIDDHCHAIGHDWTHCKRAGDRVSRFQLTPAKPVTEGGDGRG